MKAENLQSCVDLIEHRLLSYSSQMYVTLYQYLFVMCHVYLCSQITVCLYTTQTPVAIGSVHPRTLISKSTICT